MYAGMTPVTAVSDNAKLITMPVFLKVFIMPEATPYLAGGEEAI